MAIRNESNFPNSRITAQLQAVDTFDPARILNIEGQEVVIGGHTYRTLLTQIAQVSGTALAADANISQYQGMSSFNMSNAFIPEGYDKITIVRTPLTDSYNHYKGATHIADILLTYTDATKSDLLTVERV